MRFWNWLKSKLKVKSPAKPGRTRVFVEYHDEAGNPVSVIAPTFSQPTVTTEVTLGEEETETT